MNKLIRQSNIKDTKSIQRLIFNDNSDNKVTSKPIYNEPGFKKLSTYQKHYKSRYPSTKMVNHRYTTKFFKDMPHYKHKMPKVSGHKKNEV